ncbi:pituitary tumor-transforming gene 1 protein-interacting protein-like [Watersipora subatra]|uniref:pituitary tumor-transforming gene 1 protein-interacting protein-like n=1 Tax=Watersipora subatra TaxID=2589382 RepID=UPI00355AF9B1
MKILFVLLVVCVTGVFGATISTVGPTSTTDNGTVCSQYNDCDSCVGKSQGKCVYCNDVGECRNILSKGFFNEAKVCSSLMNASWVTCSVNMMALIIGMGVVGGVLIISICACICCCCCCKDSAKQKLKWMRQDAASERKAEERKAKYAERRAERQAKNDELRKKYGLFKDGQGGYQKMEDEN